MNNKKNLLLLLVVVLFLVSCGRKVENTSEEAISIKIPHSAQGNIDFRSILEDIRKMIQLRLPNAKYAATIYRGTCNDLTLDKGKVTFLFIKDQKSWFGLRNQIVYAGAVVDISEEKVDISITDVTEYKPSTLKYKEIDNQKFHEILSTIQARLTEKKIENCSLEITQLLNYWHVLVRSTNNTGYLDEFGINSDNEVITPPNTITK